jgi:hypothetical protein
MTEEGQWLPTIVGYRTHILPDDGVRLDLQVVLTLQDQRDRKYHQYTLACHRNVAKDLADVLLKTLKLMEEGPTPLQ